MESGETSIVEELSGSEEEAVVTRKGESSFIHKLVQKLPVNVSSGRLPIREVGEEVLSLAKIACPVMMTTLLLFSRQIISMLFLSHLGKTELAGGSLALGFANITGQSIMKGLSVGMDPISGQAFGAKRWSVLTHTFHKTLFLLVLVAIPVSVLWLFVEPIFLRLGQDPEITLIAKGYMVYIIPELFAQAALNPMRVFLKTQGFATSLTMAAVAAVFLHIPINYFFAIYLKLGANGVALALACNTINMNIGLLIFMLVYEIPVKPWHALSGFSLFKGWKPLLSLAIPSVISVCLEWWLYEILLFLCGLLNNPKASISAMGILIQTTGLLYVFPSALACSLTTRVGHALGAGQHSRAQWSTIIGVTLAFAYGSLASISTCLLRSVWGKLYTNDPFVLDLFSVALPVLGLCEIGNSPQTAACGVLTGSARPKDGARINLCSFYLVGLPVAILLTFELKLGFVGLWFGLLSSQITCLILMLYTLIKTDWRYQVKRAEDMTLALGGNTRDDNDLETGLLANEVN